MIFALVALTLLLSPQCLPAQNMPFMDEDTTYYFEGHAPFMMTCSGLRHDAFFEGQPSSFYEVTLFKGIDPNVDHMTGTVNKQYRQQLDAFVSTGDQTLSFFWGTKKITESTLEKKDGKPYMITSSREFRNHNTMDFAGFLFLMRAGTPASKFSKMTMLACGKPLRVEKTEYENDGKTETYKITLEEKYYAVVKLLLDEYRTPLYLDVFFPAFHVTGTNSNTQ